MTVFLFAEKGNQRKKVVHKKDNCGSNNVLIKNTED